MKTTIADFQVSPASSLQQVMRCIDHNAKGIALVVDEQQRLLGTVTDGDLRRALLRGATLECAIESYMGRHFTVVGPQAGRAEVLDLMRARHIEQVPIVDGEGKLVGLHVLREIIGTIERPNWAVIMAGGRGERLRPITDTLPKPMLRVAGKPILERIVLHLVGFGIQEIFVSVNYLSDVIQQHFGDGSAFGCRIRYLREDKPLGTGGALSLLPATPTDPVLVMNGDLVTQVDIGAMLALHAQGEFKITVGVEEYAHAVPYGCVQVEDDRILQLEEKPVVTRLVNAGIYALSPEIVGRVPRDQNFPITSLIEQAINLGERVGAFQITEDWIDVGHRDQLHLAQRGHHSP
jgi:dTDP-glucose pyrophosphorylase/predicted transcriptional regulator